MPLTAYALKGMINVMDWKVNFHEEFQPEFDAFPAEVQDELLAEALYIRRFGPQAGRPHVDTLKGSDYSNMKELRFEATDGEWRAAFAFDPKREAVVLVAADKSGGSEKQFYKALIAKADKRYSQHLQELKVMTDTSSQKASKKRKGRTR